MIFGDLDVGRMWDDFFDVGRICIILYNLKRCSR